MGQYSIKEVEKLTGIKAHTIRIWEQRYDIVLPHRTSTNIRYYDDNHLKKLLNVSMLIKHGKKISSIACMSDDALNQEVLSMVKCVTGKQDFFEMQVDMLAMSMIELDEIRFEKVFSGSVSRFGFEQTMIQILIPFMRKVGMMWSTGEISVAQEHFISNLIRRKVIVAIDELSVVQKPAPRFLLFLPEGEWHEIGLLFAKYLIKSRGFHSLYLGQSVPLADILNLKKIWKPDFLLSFFTTSFNQHKLIPYMKAVVEAYDYQKIFLCGPQASAFANQLPDQTVSITTLMELIKQLDNIRWR
ncbi:MAG: MerR family transcriptional regulator [Flavobacteriales bacterium]|nr:MerR family transcriptional regulator [Flavobacteriales bacterium]